jgi:hypothetical protein
MRTILQHFELFLIGTLALGLLGCETQVVLVPNQDPSLRKPVKAFAADAAKRQYEADAPKVADTDFRGQYALILRRIDLANISERDWDNVEVWVNGKYVVYCPTFAKKSDKSLAFRLFYDNQGHRFDTDSGKNPIQSLEVYRDGVMYSVVDHVAD